MKKIICVFLVIVISIFILQSCCNCDNTVDDPSSGSSMFVIIENEISNNYIIVYKDTKVMYSISNDSYNEGIFTLLVNPDGSPMLYED